jgi:outer membrane beta-barrel protein
MSAHKTTLIFAFMIMSASAFAQKADNNKAPAGPPAPAAAPGQPGAKPDDGKVDISDLENKYWAPKDTDFTVVQNRTYTKEKKIFVALSYGMPAADPYNAGGLYALTTNYFFTERHGIQLQYIEGDLEANSAVSDLRNFSTGVFPDHGKLHNYWSIGYNFVPFYSKMSFMGRKILYFDMAITPTLGQTKYDQILKNANASETALTYGIDVTQYYFFSRWFALRFDWKNQWYSQKVLKFEDTALTGQKEADSAGTKQIHDSLLLFGAQFFF